MGNSRWKMVKVYDLQTKNTNLNLFYIKRSIEVEVSNG